MDSAGRISQREHHAVLDARDRREAEYRKRISELEAALGSLVTVYYQDMRGAGRRIKDVDATLAPMRRVLTPPTE